VGAVMSVTMIGVAVTSSTLRRFLDDRALESVMLRLLDHAAGSLPLQVLAVATATGVGAFHALGPGHGKLLVGAYLASSRGQARDAVGLGGLVAAMHTGSVVVLGIAFASLQQVPGGERVDAGLRLLSGLAITGVGAWWLHRHLRLRGREPRLEGVRTQEHARHPGAAHAHAHHSHGAGSHDHMLPEEVRPLSRAGVLALATSGGLLPSPAALVMLASAIAIGRPAHGLVLVLAFSLGLAATLTGVGLSIVWGRGRLERLGRTRPQLTSAARALPIVAATAVMGGGLVLAGAAALRL
jgi:nickel/cobalt transporter (NicO) family protein